MPPGDLRLTLNVGDDLRPVSGLDFAPLNAVAIGPFSIETPLATAGSCRTPEFEELPLFIELSLALTVAQVKFKLVEVYDSFVVSRGISCPLAFLPAAFTSPVNPNCC